MSRMPGSVSALSRSCSLVTETVASMVTFVDGVPARGLNGEAYRGHVFWDELYVYPFLNLRLPEITRELIMYRYRRLGEARHHPPHQPELALDDVSGLQRDWQLPGRGEHVVAPHHASRQHGQKRLAPQKV